MPPSNADLRKSRLDKLEAGLIHVKQEDTTRCLLALFKLVDTEALGNSLVRSISFPSNYATIFGGSKRDREVARVVLFLARFKEALERPANSSIEVLRKSTTPQNLTVSLKDAPSVPLPNGGDNAKFNDFALQYKASLDGWAESLASTFRTKFESWDAKFNPQSIINEKQRKINEENAKQFDVLRENIAALDRRMRSVETKIEELEKSHVKFREIVSGYQEQLLELSRALQSAVIRVETKIDAETNSLKEKIIILSRDVAENKDAMSALEEEVKILRERVFAVTVDVAGEKAKLAALTDKFNALQGDFLEQCGFLAEVAVGAWLTMETVRLQWEVTSRVLAATEQVRVLLAGQREAKEEYNQMLSDANWKEELLEHALDVVLMAAEAATPLPFNTIVRVLRTNRKYVFGRGPIPGAVPTEEPEDSDGGDDSVNPVKQLFAPIAGAAEEIEDERVSAFVETQVTCVEAAISEKGKEVIEKYFKIPLFQSGWTIPNPPTFDASIEQAKDETILRLHERMDSAIKGMLDRKKLKYAVQAAYYASGGNCVGGVKPAEVAERVFQRVKAAFTDMWSEWDTNLMTVLQPDRKPLIKEAFLVLFLGGFLDYNSSNPGYTVDSLPEPFVKWLVRKQIVEYSSKRSGEVYKTGKVPWRGAYMFGSNANHKLVVFGVFRKILLNKKLDQSGLTGLFRLGTVDVLADVDRVVVNVGDIVERLKKKNWSALGKRVSFESFDDAIPSVSLTSAQGTL